MAYEGIETVKNVYQDELISHSMNEKALRVRKSDFKDPIFEGYEIHPEEEPNVADMTNSLMDIGVDLYALDLEFMHAAGHYNAIMEMVDNSLTAVDEVIAIEQERIEDMNMINGEYKDFSAVRTLTASDFSGNCSYLDDERTFTTQASDRTEISISVDDVKGNGYEGNKYVYKNGMFLKDTLPTDERKYMTDGDDTTAYEYSRITMDKENVMPPDANLDTEEAECAITLYGKNYFNTIKLSSDIDTNIIEDIETSEDGANFTSVLDGAIAINKKENMYNYCDYIYGSGILCFPSTYILRLHLKSNGTTEDNLAYEQNKFNKDTNKQENVIQELQTAKRHVIRVNNIKAMKGTFSSKSVMETGELITTPVESLAVFANEYIPSTFDDDGTKYIEYYFIINGKEYEVVPVNSNANGTKVLRHADYVTTDTYAEHLSEPIKSAYLRIVMHTPYSSYSPYLSNVKICFGKAAQ